MSMQSIFFIEFVSYFVSYIINETFKNLNLRFNFLNLSYEFD